jgi:hypothetical protein
MNARFGLSVASAGDVNGDGYADVVIGAPLSPNPEGGSGQAAVFLGGTPGIAEATLATAAARVWGNVGTNAVPDLGTTVAGAGDVNGDGYADVIIRTSEFTPYAFVLHGGPAGPASGLISSNGGVQSATLVAGAASIFFGFNPPVSGAGDVDGDGFADVLVGNGSSGVYVFRGSGDRKSGFGDVIGRKVQARQLKTSGPIPPWGLSDFSNQFRVSMTLTHPDGRGRVRLEAEACPQAVLFGGAGCTVRRSAQWQLIPTGSAEVSTSVDLVGLAAGQLYHWRARTLYAPTTGALPPAPAHGPWRRHDAQTVAADLRLPADRDGDAIPDGSDKCPYFPSPDQTDTDSDNRGNVCECGDQNGDGRNTVADLVAINRAIFITS